MEQGEGDGEAEQVELKAHRSTRRIWELVFLHSLQMCNSKFSKSIKYSETAIRLIICIAVVATIAPPQRNNNSNNSNSHSHLGLAIITIIILEMKVS